MKRRAWGVDLVMVRWGTWDLGVDDMTCGCGIWVEQLSGLWVGGTWAGLGE